VSVCVCACVRVRMCVSVCVCLQTLYLLHHTYDVYFFAGVTVVEIVLAQIIAFFIVMVIQLTPTFFTIIYGFDVSLL